MPTILARTAALCAAALLAIPASHAQQAHANPPRHPHHRSLGLLLRPRQTRPHHQIRRHRHHPDPLHLRPPRAPQALGVAEADIPSYVDDIYTKVPASRKRPRRPHPHRPRRHRQKPNPATSSKSASRKSTSTSPGPATPSAPAAASSPTTSPTATPASSPSTAKR